MQSSEGTTTGGTGGSKKNNTSPKPIKKMTSINNVPITKSKIASPKGLSSKPTAQVSSKQLISQNSGNTALFKKTPGATTSSKVAASAAANDTSSNRNSTGSNARKTYLGASSQSPKSN